MKFWVIEEYAAKQLQFIVPYQATNYEVPYHIKCKCLQTIVLMLTEMCQYSKAHNGATMTDNKGTQSYHCSQKVLPTLSGQSLITI